MKKKLLTVSVVCALICTCLFSFTACSGTNETPPPPSGGTCENGHTEVTDVGKAATCTEAGLTDGKYCSVCGTVLEAQTPVPVSDHDFVNNVCTGCGIACSVGLKYISNEDGTCYVGGIGTCTDKNLVIPSKSPDGLSVIGIGDKAFSDHTQLESIIIPNSVTSIGISAFSGCTNLLQVENNVSYADRWAVDCVLHAPSVTLRSDTVGIANQAFSNCSSLTDISIPRSVKHIGDSAFEYCSWLREITIPEDVLSIKDNTFRNCKGLQHVFFAENSKLTSIGNKAFYGCQVLMNITLPKRVTDIGGLAFSECEILTSVVLPDGITTIGNSAFQFCPALTSITIPASVTRLGSAVFNHCTALTSVTFSENGGLTQIPINMFRGCSSLTTVTIPKSITTIGDSAFANCSNLTTITISDSVTNIGSHAFSDCRDLISIIYQGTVAQWNEVTKETNWNFYVPAMQVVCTDGTVKLK